MRSFLFLCLLTVANCKPGAIFVPSPVSHAVPFGVAVFPFSTTGIAPPVLTVQEVMLQTPGIRTVSEYQAIPYYQNTGAVVADFLY